MNAKIVIPKGWRRVACGDFVRRRDLVLYRAELEWCNPYTWIGYKQEDDMAVGEYVGPEDYVIRRT